MHKSIAIKQATQKLALLVLALNIQNAFSINCPPNKTAQWTPDTFPEVDSASPGEISRTCVYNSISKDIYIASSCDFYPSRIFYNAGSKGTTATVAQTTKITWNAGTTLASKVSADVGIAEAEISASASVSICRESSQTLSINHGSAEYDWRFAIWQGREVVTVSVDRWIGSDYSFDITIPDNSSTCSDQVTYEYL